jgi:PAS domain S-box-containing protein
MNTQMLSRPMEDRIFAAITEHTPAVISVKSLEGRFLYVNQEFLRLFSLSRQEVVGKIIYDIMPREIADALMEHDKIVIAKGTPDLFEEEILSNEELRTYSTIKFPLRDDSGAIYGIAGIATEITVQKQLERELQLAKNLADALNHVNALIHSSLNANEIMAKISEVTAKALDLRGFSIGMFEDDYYVMKNSCCISGLFQRPQSGAQVCGTGTGRLPGLHNSCTCDDNALRQVYDWRRPFSQIKGLALAWSRREVVVMDNIQEDEQTGFDFLKQTDIRSLILAPLISRGEVIGTLNFFYSSASVPHSEQLVDFAGKLANSVSLAIENARLYEQISTAEEAARKREEQLRIIADFAYDWEYWIDPEGKQIYVSPSCEKITGYRPEDFLNNQQLLSSLVHPADREVFMAHRQLHLEGNREHLELEYRIVSKAGEKRWIAHACLPVYGKDGGFLGRRASNRDITEQKRTEEELLKAKKIESIGILAGGIAHDFNNFLTAILGNITLAKTYLDPGDKAHEKLALAERASFRARGLTQQLLTFARGGIPVRKVVAVAQLVHDPVELALRGSNVRCEYQLPAELWAIEVDEGQFHQVISNLAINAVQAMPAGGILRVSGRNEAVGPENVLGLPAGNYVRIAIEDQGLGIREENLDKIFDPYFTTRETGSGLGLSISYSIVKKHGGTLTVESTPGKGSVFSVYLPASAKKAEPAPVEENGSGPGTGLILVMDDDELVNQVAADMLRHLGYRTETARDGAEAMAAFKKAKARGKPFDAVITDLTVAAGMGGRETVRRLLELDPTARVIVSSGYAEDPIMSNYAEYGFKGVIPKPYKLEELKRIIREVMEST